MALEWFYTQFRSTTSVFSDFWTLVQLQPGVTLKRTVLSWYIDSIATDNESVLFWTTRNIVNTLEITFGDPPPFPENPGVDPLSGRDLLHLDTTRLSVDPVVSPSFVMASALNDASIGRWDTKVQRKNDAVGAELFWSWGVTQASALPPGGARSRFTSAVLVDGPDVALQQMAVQERDRAARLEASRHGGTHDS